MDHGKKPDDRPQHADRDQEAERKAARKRKLDEALDTGLEETFPGSDPVAITQPPRSARDKRRP